jgi:DNA primase
MSRIPQAFIDDILNRLDIVDVVDSRVKLKRSGKNYMACCPFHNEKTPSFTVSPDKQFYYCFGCGASGNALGFIMEFERQSFIEAIESTAKQLGLSIPRDENPKSASEHKDPSLYQILDQASRFYEQQLHNHPERRQASQYLQQRGLTADIIALFGIGYAPSGWDHLLNHLGTSEQLRQQLMAAGLIVENEETTKRYDRFRHRIMFPIRDLRGRVIGFGGRILGTESKGTDSSGKKAKSSGPKYLNSPETEVFHKGKELYGLYQARQANRNLQQLLVVEGYMDVIALTQFDITFAVATLGTACGEDHLRLAFKYCNEIVFCFDGDNAGRTAAKRALENALPAMEDGRQIRFLFLPEGQDPDSLVRQIGKDRFEQQIKQAMPLEDFFFRSLAEGINTNSMEGRARLSKMAAPQLHRLPKGVYRELMFNQLAALTGLSLDVLHELVQAPETLDPNSPAPIARTNAPSPAKSFTAHKHHSRVRLTPARMAIMLLLEHPTLAGLAADWQQPEDPEDPDQVRLAQLIKLVQHYKLQSFHSIIGFWAGEYGLDSQRALTALVADQFLGSVQRGSPFDASQELKDALNRLRESAQLKQQHSELAQLQALPLEQLDETQKQRLRDLVKAKLNSRPSLH